MSSELVPQDDATGSERMSGLPNALARRSEVRRSIFELSGAQNARERRLFSTMSLPDEVVAARLSVLHRLRVLWATRIVAYFAVGVGVAIAGLVGVFWPGDGFRTSAALKSLAISVPMVLLMGPIGIFIESCRIRNRLELLKHLDWKSGAGFQQDDGSLAFLSGTTFVLETQGLVDSVTSVAYDPNHAIVVGSLTWVLGDVVRQTHRLKLPASVGPRKAEKLVSVLRERWVHRTPSGQGRISSLHSELLSAESDVQIALVETQPSVGRVSLIAEEKAATAQGRLSQATLTDGRVSLSPPERKHRKRT
ncbi:MAG: hypothetical protein IPK13_12020 [Deltaproteobacteria bacterium]|nr:hypothetical protein [Deltaproteobacteria bacterium]